MTEQHPLLPGKQKRVAFITDALASTSFTQRILSGIALFIQERRGIVLQQIPSNEIARDSLTGQFDGIIINLCAKETHALLDMLNGASLPIVDLSAEVEDPSLIRVDNDIVREGTMAAEWFLRRVFLHPSRGVQESPWNEPWEIRALRQDARGETPHDGREVQRQGSRRPHGILFTGILLRRLPRLLRTPPV